MEFGVMNEPPAPDREYGVTRYWAKVEGKRIEFTALELDREDVPRELANYIRSMYKEY